RGKRPGLAKVGVLAVAGIDDAFDGVVAEEQHGPRGAVAREVVEREGAIASAGGRGAAGEAPHWAARARLPSQRGIERGFDRYVGARAKRLNRRGLTGPRELFFHAGAVPRRWVNGGDALLPPITQ